MKKKIFLIISGITFILFCFLHLDLENNEVNGETVRLSSVRLALAEGEGGKKDFVCCDPKNVSCVEAPNLTVWGTLKSGTSCD